MNDDFEIVGDAAREARVVAVVLGEASDFEQEEVERLCEENPELAVFRRRMEAVHGLIGESGVPSPESGAGEWRLSKERRESVLAKLGEEETVVAGPKRKIRFLGLNPWQHAALIAVACVVIGLLVPTRMRMTQGESSLAAMAQKESRFALVEEDLGELASMKRQSMRTSRETGSADMDLNQLVTVAGQVREPGPKGFKSGMTVEDALGDAGGVSTFGTSKRVNVYREGKKYALDLTNEKHRGERIYPGDTVEVDQVKAWESGGEGGGELREKAIAAAPVSKPTAPSSSLAKVISSNTVSPTAIPVPEVSAPIAAVEFGDGDDYGTGWGMKEKPGGAVASNELKVTVFDAGLLPALEGTPKLRSPSVDAFAASDESLSDRSGVVGMDADPFASDEGSSEGRVAGGALSLDDDSDGERGNLAAAQQELAQLEAGHPNNVDHFSAPSEEDVARYEERVEAARGRVTQQSNGRGGRQVQVADQFGEMAKNNTKNHRFAWRNEEVDEVPKLGNLPEDFALFLRSDGSESFGVTPESEVRGLLAEQSSLNFRSLHGGDNLAGDVVTGSLGRYSFSSHSSGSSMLGFEAIPSENFDDSIRRNPSVTAEHGQNVDEVRRLLYKGEGHYNLADYDESEKVFEEVLQIDPNNKTARRWLERNAAIKADYYRAAYDQTRAQMLMEVDAAWELTVPSAYEAPGKDDLGLFAALEREEEILSEETQSLVDNEELFCEDQAGSPREGLLTNKLQNIIIPRVDFENTPLDEALEYLTQKTLELDPDPDPERKGVNFVLEKGSVDSGFEGVDEKFGSGSLLLGNDPSEKSIDVLQLRNVPLATALEYIASKTGLRYRIDDDKVTLLAIGSESSADLVTRTWDISPEAYAQLMEEREQSEFEAEQDGVVSEQEALQNSGVDFPDGSSVRYIISSGSLLVRNTVSNLDLVDQIVEELSNQAKVAQETLAMDEKDAATERDSTFSLHVSDVSFKLAKAALEQGKWPETVRVEEFVNAFSYGERALAPNERVGVAMEQAAHPFLSQRNLLRVSLQTAATGRGAGVPLRLTVVLDKSGSMERLDRAAAVDEAFRVLVDQLNPGDRVTLVGFSRTPTLLADFVDGAEGDRLLKILRETPSEGGTNVEEALKLARAKALEHFQEGAQNRVILLTDGIANLGEAVPEQLMTLVEGMREEEVAFDACGVGVEGLNDDILEALTRKGDGRYYLLGSTAESGADFAKQVAGALRPAAQNVKVQIEWNADRVGKWKLYGYEKHELKKEDFRNDSVDAAEMAAEEEGVALYHVEVKPDGEGPLGVARVRFLDVANNEMVEREWEISYEGEAPTLSEADQKIRLAGVVGLVAEKLARSAVGERAEWDELLEMTRQLETVFPKEERVKDLERMIEQAKGLE